MKEKKRKKENINHHKSHLIKNILIDYNCFNFFLLLFPSGGKKVVNYPKKNNIKVVFLFDEPFFSKIIFSNKWKLQLKNKKTQNFLKYIFNEHQENSNLIDIYQRKNKTKLISRRKKKKKMEKQLNKIGFLNKKCKASWGKSVGIKHHNQPYSKNERRR